VGVRQGCVLSPLLFLIFINTLALEINKHKLGIQVQHRNISLLLFADDIVLLAESADKLQQMLNQVFYFCSKWRSEVNAKKTEVMIFGPKPKKKYEWRFGEVKLNVTDKYKYLGLDFCSNLSWKKTKERFFAKARAKASAAFSMANASEILNVEFGVNIWQTLIRPSLEYGCEVWSEDAEWVDAERLQLFVAKRILRCSTNTSNEAVLGELGWWTMKARRDMLRMRYWRKIVNMDESRVTKLVYLESKKRFNRTMKERLQQHILDMNILEERIRNLEKEEEDKSDIKMTLTKDKEQLRKVKREVRRMKTESWCACTFATLMRYGLDKQWEREWLDSDWVSVVKRAVKEKEQEEWRRRMQLKPKLRTYRKVKDELKMESYLLTCNGHAGAYDLFRLRSGSNVLRIETGRYVGLDEKDRTCLCCMSDETESEDHFLMDCSFYSNERKKCYDLIKRTTNNEIDMNELNTNGRRNILMLNVNSNLRKQVQHLTLSFIHRIYKHRQSIQPHFMDK
jgi:hypothetical protein